MHLKNENKNENKNGNKNEINNGSDCNNPDTRSTDDNQDRKAGNIKLNKSNKRKNDDTDMKMNTRRGKFTSPMGGDIPNNFINETVIRPLQTSFEKNQMKILTHSNVNEKLHENNPKGQLNQEIMPFPLKLKPVSEFFISLRNTSISPTRENKMQNHNWNDYQCQEKNQNNETNHDFQKINNSEGKEKKIQETKIKKTLEENENKNENEKFQSSFYENISKPKYQLQDLKSEKFENQSKLQNNIFDNNEMDRVDDFFFQSTKLSSSQSSSESDNLSNEINLSPNKSKFSTEFINEKSNIKLIENQLNKNQQIIQKRKIKAMKIVYPYFGSEVKQMPKIIALRCLEFLEGKDFYNVSILNNLWCKTALDPALWEDSIN